MLVLAARQLRLSTAIATRQWPYVSPPARAETFDTARLDGQDIIYVCAHGLSGADFLCGDNGTIMLTGGQIEAARMPGAVVWLGGCYGFGPLSDAFLAAGAAAVVCDRDVNWAGPLWPTGSNRLGQLFLAELYRGRTVGVALDMAMNVYAARYHGPRDAELLATMTLVGDPLARLLRVTV